MAEAETGLMEVLLPGKKGWITEIMDMTGFSTEFRKLVLVVEDELVNRSILGNIVSTEYNVIYAENGLDALVQMRTNKEILSMVLLDLMMPVMDGFRLLEIAARDNELSHIPIIVLTAEKDKEQEVRCLEYGAVDFIPKPYDYPQVILARIRRNIQLAEDSHIIQRAERDVLTGLYTREFFFEYAHQMNLYYHETKMDAMCININHFHLINEMYGHDGGDKLLVLVGKRITELLDKTGGIGCRSAADHFYVYMPHQEDIEPMLSPLFTNMYRKSSVTKKEDSSEKKQESETQDIRIPELDQDVADSGIDFANIRIRIGLYPEVDKEEELERIFDRAFVACQTLRNNYAAYLACYNNEMYEKELNAERLIKDFDAALSEKQFKVYYQAKYLVQGERPVLASAEALVRWFHPELGFISPGAFIPLFEENGLVQSLDHYVWDEAASQIRKWKDRYGITVPISVNVSRIDIYNPNLERNLLRIVNREGLTPGELLLEVTESAYTDDSKQIIQVVESLRKNGFKIEMDDFGSGYSSLNMLTELPLDALKLDMAFIRNMTASKKNMKMVELMMDIAQFLEVPVIAEGVETEEQFSLLKRVGCDIIQGYYFSKPIPAEEFEAIHLVSARTGEQ